MIRFNNDYNHGAHPEILEALGAINENSYGGYGEDEWCEKAAELIREKIRCADAPGIRFWSCRIRMVKFRRNRLRRVRRLIMKAVSRSI